MNSPKNNLVEAVIAQLNKFMPANMTQYELSQKSGLPFSTIKSIFQRKTNNITLKTIIMLASGVGVTPWEFIHDNKFLVENLDV